MYKIDHLSEKDKKFFQKLIILLKEYDVEILIDKEWYGWNGVNTSIEFYLNKSYKSVNLGTGYIDASLLDEYL